MTVSCNQSFKLSDEKHLIHIRTTQYPFPYKLGISSLFYSLYKRGMYTTLTNPGNLDKRPLGDTEVLSMLFHLLRGPHDDRYQSLDTAIGKWRPGMMMCSVTLQNFL